MLIVVVLILVRVLLMFTFLLVVVVYLLLILLFRILVSGMPIKRIYPENEQDIKDGFYSSIPNAHMEVTHTLGLPPVESQQLGVCLYLHSTELIGIIYSQGLGNGVYTKLSAQDLIDNVRTMYPRAYIGKMGDWAYMSHVDGYLRYVEICEETVYPFEGIRNLSPQIPPMGVGNGVYTRLSAQDLIDNVRTMYPRAYIGRVGDWAYMSHVAGYLRHVGICEEAVYHFEGIRNLSPQIPPM
ncbi:hypothetical protein OROGR_028783 [Orobanche gracilis]